MLNEYCMTVCESWGMNWKPESRPVSLKFVQGVWNVDCVTVWFFETNWNAMVSPSTAVMLGGLNASWPWSPTTTTCVAASTEAAGRARAAKTVEKRILIKANGW